MNKVHQYSVSTQWTGNKGSGTSNYRAFDRDHSISSKNKVEILCSSDPAFRGDNSKYNPEELLVASLSSCHMLWYLHLCAEAEIIVTDYQDNAVGMMIESSNGSGAFQQVTLNPVVVVAEESMLDSAGKLHEKAHEMCFIANSVNFNVRCKAACKLNRRR